MRISNIRKADWLDTLVVLAIMATCSAGIMFEERPMKLTETQLEDIVKAARSVVEEERGPAGASGNSDVDREPAYRAQELLEAKIREHCQPADNSGQIRELLVEAIELLNTVDPDDDGWRIQSSGFMADCRAAGVNTQ